jgi:branched-subunit amino acid transport protein AzlD
MKQEIVYMVCVIAACFAVNYLLRALPFLLFAGRDRELPPWVERFGNVVSPVIIAALIVYSYTGLAWKTAYPYLAGAFVIGLQLWKRNALVSIVAGTILYMALLTCGCASRPPIEFDAENPVLRVSRLGVLFGERFVEPAEVPAILKDYDIPHDRVIHIRLDAEVKDLRPARALMAHLRRTGYTRPVLVTKRHAESFVTEKPKRETRRGGMNR